MRTQICPDKKDIPVYVQNYSTNARWNLKTLRAKLHCSILDEHPEAECGWNQKVNETE